MVTRTDFLEQYRSPIENIELLAKYGKYCTSNLEQISAPALAVVNGVRVKQNYALAAIITTVALAILAGTGVGLVAGAAMGVITGLAVGVFAIFPYMYRRNVTNIGEQQQQILQGEIEVVASIYDQMAQQFLELRDQREQSIIGKIKTQGSRRQVEIEEAVKKEHEITIEYARKILNFNNQLATAYPHKNYPSETTHERMFAGLFPQDYQSAWNHLQKVCRGYIKPHRHSDKYINFVTKGDYNSTLVTDNTIREYDDYLNLREQSNQLQAFLL